MTSLRVALKLSMADVKPDEKSHKRKNPMLHDKPVEEPTLDDILSGRKRRASFESKESKSKVPSKGRSGRSTSPTEESLTGRSEGSGYYYAGENTSIISEEPRKATAEDHESIASMKGDDISIMDEGATTEHHDEHAPAGNDAKENPGDNNDETANDGETGVVDGPTAESKNADAEGEAEVDADNEGDGDAGSPRAVKKRRKRTSSILKSLELISGEEHPPVAMEDEGTGVPRYQSSRAAAMVAKTKISAKGAVRSSSVEDLSAADVAGVAPVVPRRRKNNAAVVGPELNWVQCDRCAKWRSVAEHIDHAALPDQWFCEMNTWDLHLNNCDAAEETEQPQPQIAAPVAVRGRASRNTTDEGLDGDQGATEGGQGKGRVWVKAGHGGRGRWRRTGDGEDGADDEIGDGIADPNAGEAGDDQGLGGVSSRRRNTGGSPRLGTSAAALGRGVSGGAAAANTALPSGEAVAAVNWVQCNKCRKWRKVPETVDVDALPEKWYCSLNTWNPAVARCGAKQEADDTVTTTAVEAPGASGKGGNRPRRSQGGVGIGDFAPPGTIKKVSWVQCERRNCKKWRKVPAHIDMDQFPEKWYCEMNTWDLDSATCDAPEASDSENEQPGGAASRQQLILGNSKSANALSYRRIIFGTDGRIRVCFSDKNKNGYGIFSYAEAHKPSNDADDYTAPTRRVGYWWSGAYDETAGMAAAITHHTPGRGGAKKAGAAVPVDGQTSAIPASDVREPPAPSYLLDTARRMSGMASPPPAFIWPKKVCKSWTILSNMPLFRRQNLECTVVMSCFMAASASSVLFSKLFTLVSICRFPDPEVEACRAYMNMDVLKATVRRLEERGLVSVSYAGAGQLSVEVLPSIAQLTLQCTTKSVPAVAAATGVSAAWAKQGLPLKLRKFHADSKYKTGAAASSTAAAPEVNDAGSSATASVPTQSQSIGDSELAAESTGSQEANQGAEASASVAPMKPFRLQHKDKWASMNSTM